MLLRYVPLLPDKTVKGVFSVKSLALCFAPTAACGKSQITNNRQPETAGIGVLFCVVLLLFCGDSPALCLFADFGEFLIKAFFLYQLIMRAALYLIHTVKRSQPECNAQHRQNDGQNHLFPFAFGISKK